MDSTPNAVSGRWTARALALIAALAFAGCAASNHATGPLSSVADDEQQADGQTMKAKPGMGRLYILHGDSIQSPGASPIFVNAIGFLVLVGIAAVREAARGDAETDPPTAKQNQSAEDYWLGDHRLGAMQGRQYMAIDLPPGEYSLSFRRQGYTSLLVGLEADQVEYVVSMAVSKDFWMQFCDVRCRARFKISKRVVADPPTLKPATQQGAP